ncbi:hypothetical protein KAI87_17215, partial [Myxococcota bacterium]|nr:hypothetical protein [Myxococcota bacterium]
MGERVFVTGWFRHHGIGFLDPVLESLRKVDSDSHEKKVWVENTDQYELAETLGYSGKSLESLPVAFDRIIYLVPAKLDEAVFVRHNELIGDEKWSSVLSGVAKVPPAWDGWEQAFEKLREEIREKKSFPLLDWFRREWECGEDNQRLQVLWHIINVAPLRTQIEWYKACSTLYLQNKDKFEFVELEVDDIDDTVNMAKALRKWVRKQPGDIDQLYVNLWGTATTLQFAWYFLAWRMPKLNNATFIECKTNKNKDSDRFAPIHIEKIEKD